MQPLPEKKHKTKTVAQDGWLNDFNDLINVLKDLVPRN